MARQYNIIERLKAKNERPHIILDEGHDYKINTSKTNVLGIIAVTSKAEKKDDPEADMKMIDKVIEMALGKEALEYISSQDYTVAVYQDILDVIMAAISDEDASYQKEPKK